jgi:hypothetical protein
MTSEEVSILLKEKYEIDKKLKKAVKEKEELDKDVTEIDTMLYMKECLLGKGKARDFKDACRYIRANYCADSFLGTMFIVVPQFNLRFGDEFPCHNILQQYECKTLKKSSDRQQELHEIFHVIDPFVMTQWFDHILYRVLFSDQEIYYCKECALHSKILDVINFEKYQEIIDKI